MKVSYTKNTESDFFFFFYKETKSNKKKILVVRRGGGGVSDFFQKSFLFEGVKVREEWLLV